MTQDARKSLKAERSAISDRRMIEATIRIVLQRGIRGVRLTDVSLEAGYSRSLAIMRFGTLDSLLRRVADHLERRWVKELTDAVGDNTGLEAIYAALDCIDRWLAEPVQLIRVSYLIFFHSIDPGTKDGMNVARVVMAERKDLARWISAGVKAGTVNSSVDPEAESGAVLSSMIGTIYQALVDPNLSAKPLLRKLKADIAARLAPVTFTPAKSASAASAASRRRRVRH